jgi:Transposase DDE domain
MKVSEKLFKPLYDCEVHRIGNETRVDEYSKKLKLTEHVKLLVAYVILRFESLGDLCELADKYDGLIKISKPQISKINSTRDYMAFAHIFYNLLCHRSCFRKHWQLRRFVGKKILGIDSTTITVGKPLKVPIGQEPLSEKEGKGIKIHLAALLGTLVQPISAIVTPSNFHDDIEFDDLLEDVSLIEQLKNLILVFDKGYTNYDRYKKFVDKGILFVARLKKNAKYTVLSSTDYKYYTEQEILLDGMELRLIKYKDIDGTDWIFITNIPAKTLSSDDIREIYKMRWMIEIFFRELKLSAKIEHLYSKNVNGVMIQIYATLIAYTLMNMFLIEYDSWKSVSKGVEMVRHVFNEQIEILLDD